MNNHLLTSTITAATTVAAITLLAFLKRTRDRKQALDLLAATPCHHCGETYGGDKPGDISRLRYYWTPLRGNRIACMDLPGTTFLAKCSHCGAEAEFRENGRIFVHPLAGVCGHSIKTVLRYPPVT